MKFVVSILLILIISFVSGLYLPWWSIALVAFIVVAVMPQKPWYAFLSGFLAIFILWSGVAFMISNKNEHILAHKVALIILKTDSPVSLILVTGLIGAVVAGCAALAASFVRRPA